MVRTAEAVRDARIMELVCQGTTITDIARQFGLSQGRVSQIVTKYKTEWLAKREVLVEDHIAVEIMTLRNTRQEAWEAWGRSKNSDETTVTTTRTPLSKEAQKKYKGAKEKVSTIRKERQHTGQVGDIACLHLVETCTDKLLKLLNAYPKEESQTNVVINQWDWEKMSQPIPFVEAVEATPSSEVEARIESELKSEHPLSSNGNGHV